MLPKRCLMSSITRQKLNTSPLYRNNHSDGRCTDTPRFEHDFNDHSLINRHIRP